MISIALAFVLVNGVFAASHRHTVRMVGDVIDTLSRPNIRGDIPFRAPFAEFRKRAEVPAAELPYFKNSNGGVHEKKLVLLHLDHTLRADERASLSADLGGVTFDRYVPHNTWIVPLTADQAELALKHKFVAWVGAYEDQHKVTGVLLHQMSRLDVEAAVEEQDLIVVLFEDERSNNEMASVREQLMAVVASTPDAAPAHALDIDNYRFEVTVAASTVGAVQTLVRTLCADARVMHVERRIRHAVHNKAASWLTQSGSPEKRPIWDKGLRGQNQVVGCADSGLDYDHCFFNDASQPAFGPSRQEIPNHRKVIAYFAFEGADYTDDIGGHGTHVVGSIVGNAKAVGDPTAQQVIGQYNGQAPDAKLVFHDIGVTGGGLTVRSAEMDTKILQPAYRLGARVHSNSWGCSGDPSVCNTYDEGARAVDSFVAQNRDMLVLFAAGNDGANGMANTQTVGSPATAKSALVIGAAQSSYESFKDSVQYYDWAERREQAEEQLGVRNLDCCNPPASSNKNAVMRFCCQKTLTQDIEREPHRHNEDNVAEFSSRGPTFDGRVKPDLLAPGQNIISAHSDGNTKTQQCGLGSPELGNNAARLSMQGTSMATPTAAGNAVLVRQYLNEGYYPTGKATPANAMKTPSGALIKGMLVASSHELTGEIDKGNNGTWDKIDPIWPGYSIFQGFGAIRLANVMRFEESNFNLYLDDSWSGGNGDAGLDNGDSVAYCVTVEGTQALRVVLVWDDAPAEPSAERAIVNDLDLQTGFSEQDRVSGNFKIKRDPVNTIEHTIFESPTRGTYYVNVTASQVPNGPQPYAVVIIGQFTKVVKGPVVPLGTQLPPNQCVSPFLQFNEDASNEDLFPYGEVLGPVAVGATLIMVLLGMVVKYLQSRQ